MRAALITGRGRLELVDVPEVAPTGTSVAVSVTLCGICGTDLSAFRTGLVHSPAVCGHEWVGTVSATGERVEDVAVGTRVVVAVPDPCAGCPACQVGLPDLCDHVAAVSRGLDRAAPSHGGFAPGIVVDQTRVLAVRAALTDVEAAQVEPSAVALHGVRRAGIRPGDLVVVQGAGPIGLLAAQCARLPGAAVVVVVEPDERRRALALVLGVDAAVAPGPLALELVRDLSQGRGADVVLECVGQPMLLTTAVDLVRRGGTVLLLGYTAEEGRYRPGVWLSREVTLRGAVASTRDELGAAMDLMVAGQILAAPLHTRTVGLTELSQVLEELARGATADLKVLVDPHR